MQVSGTASLTRSKLNLVDLAGMFELAEFGGKASGFDVLR